MEADVRRKLVEELCSLGAPPEMVAEEVKCKGGRIDILVYTQPRCLIEVKPVLDDFNLSDAIRKLRLYRSEYPGARLYLASSHALSDDDRLIRRLKNSGIRPWTARVAAQVAADCRNTTVESAAIPARRRMSSEQRRGAPSDDYADLPARYSYSSARRHVSVKEAVRCLPAADQEEARKALQSLGIAKAGGLVALLRQQPNKWREAVELAAWTGTRELQRWVSSLLGAKPRGRRHVPGESIYRQLLAALKPQERAEVAAIFDAALRRTATDNRANAFLLIFRAAKPALTGPDNAELASELDTIDPRGPKGTGQ